MVYKQKVWRLPLGAPQARGKALVNMLPLEEGERITIDHAAAGGRGRPGTQLDMMFATKRGRRAAQQAVRLRRR